MAEDIDRLVEQAREYCSGSMRKQGEALVAGLADAVEQLERHNDLVLRAMAEYREERDEACARVAALEAGVRKALDALDGMAWVDGSHIGDGYASLVTVEDYYVQEEAEDALWALLDGRVPSTGQETT